ncbi:hypothetical protein SEA_RIKSENGUPTA_22 [Microbacterium phage RikSengupta]|nr:hypothetical protein SEA_TINYMINY_22 [Microbacterium phage TinyMiny]UVF61351.1 hypothetical protein SEA_SPARCETUS_22 [Microbacterium phage Sparcetus]WMI33118.1 hypothetical protein SEA_RIKSENGUPTA_22 [Microbacterium phage RikSengupta]
MDPIELQMHRLNTEAFILAKPSFLTLTPQEKEDTPSGGYKLVEKAPRAQQMFRIIELGANQTPPVLRLTDGTQREVDFWLLGTWDAKVGINDTWTAMDQASGRIRTWLVGDIVRSNDYEVRGLVVERG